MHDGEKGMTDSLGGAMARPTMTEKLQRERENCQDRLNQLEEALVMLKENPAVQKVIDTLSRITHF